MRGCLLKVNGRPIPFVRLREIDGVTQVVVPDSEFGEFSLTPAFVLDFLDLSIPKDVRDADPSSGWTRVTYDELVKLLKDLQGRALG